MTDCSHQFDPLSDFCMGCGVSMRDAMEHDTVKAECPQNDSRTYQIARHRMNALVAPILEKLGFATPPTMQ
jgi:hypothetical protein